MNWLYRLLALLALTTPAFAGSIALTPGSGTTVGAGSDGTNQIPASILCGGAAATLYTTCAYQAEINSSGQLAVNVGNASLAVTGTFWQTTQPVSGTFWQATQPISAASLPLPSGAATSALQTTGNSTLSTINTTLGSPMQNSGGTVTATQATGTNLHVVCDSGCSSSSSPSYGATFSTTGTPIGAEYYTPGALTSGYMYPLTLDSSGFLKVNGSGATQPVSGTVTANAGTGNFLVNPGTIASWGLMSGTTPGTAPTNTLITGGIYNSSAPGPTSGQTLPLQLDASGNLNVNVKAGGGSGGTSSTFNATFPTTGTAAGGEYLSSPPTLTTGQMVALQTDVNGNLKFNLQGCLSTICPALGSAVSASSSPVVIASDQAAVAIKAASGAFASGSIASGALASGSIASGAAVSGAFVAGSIADLAHGQGTMSASVPVTIASNQSSFPITGSGVFEVSPTTGANTVTNPFFTEVTDGTHAAAATKAASTAAVATDPALVVAVSPNNAVALAAGSATIGALTPNQSVNVAQIAGAAPSTTNPLPTAPNPYPATAVPITASATGTTAATTATLTNVTGHTTYICGFSIRANATAAATGNATVTGTISGTMNYTQWTAPNASGLGVTEEVFSPCVPASGVSTSIAVVSAAPGTGGVVSVSAWGYSI